MTVAPTVIATVVRAALRRRLIAEHRGTRVVPADPPATQPMTKGLPTGSFPPSASYADHSDVSGSSPGVTLCSL